MEAWRIATDTPNYLADDLTGAGAKITGGRWNRVGLPILYCASTPSLACLETMVHLGTGSLPLNRYLVKILIPDSLWRVREVTSPPVGWDAIPPGKLSLDFGDQWLKDGRSAILVVPSVIVPEDSVILVNPLHAKAAKITATKLRKWLYDPRLF